MQFQIEAAASLTLPLGFSAEELSRLLMIPDAQAAIRYARLCGAIERIGRGRYRSVLPPTIAERIKVLFDNAREAALSLSSSFPGAMDGASAVFVWTRGGYVAGWTPWRVVIEVRVPRPRLAEAKRMMRTAGVGTHSDYPPANLLGVFAKVSTAPSVRRTFVGGVPVVPKREVLALIKKNAGAFAGAAELIEDDDSEVEVFR